MLQRTVGEVDTIVQGLTDEQLAAQTPASARRVPDPGRHGQDGHAALRGDARRRRLNIAIFDLATHACDLATAIDPGRVRRRAALLLAFAGRKV